MTAAGPGPEPQPDLGDHEEPETFLVTGPVAVPWSRGWSGSGPGVLAAASDAELARAACSDPAAFAAVYDRYSDRLHDYCTRMLRDRDAAADAVQDTFTTVATRLPQLREPDKLRPWLYAIARNEAHRRLKTRRREQLVDELPEQAADSPGPDTHAAQRELAALMNAAALGLPERERSILELHYRHGLDGPELAAALGISGTNANTVIGRARTMIERSLGALLLARRARGSHSGSSCAGLGEVLAAWDGIYSVLWRKRIARHVEHCPTCTAAVRDMVNPRALLGATPVLLPAPSWLRHHVLHHAGPGAGSSATVGAGAGAGKASWWPAAQRAVTPLRVAVAAPLIAIPAAAGLIWTVQPTATTAVLAQPAAAAPAVVGGQQPRFEFDMPTGSYRASTTVSSQPGGRPVAPSSSAPALLPRGPVPLSARPTKRPPPPNPAGPSISASATPPPETKAPPESPTTTPN